MNKTMAISALLALTIFPTICRGETQMSIPSDFPTFRVPGHEKEMDSIRHLYWLHYPGSGPKATMWDQWLAPPSLWPAVGTDNSMENMRKAWSDVLSSRVMDPEGYVSTHQHASVAHPLGWPFPFWNQGQGGYGWHFSFKDTVGGGWRTNELSTKDGWTLGGASDEGINDDGWSIKLAAPDALVTAPKHAIDTFQSPFIQFRWKAKGLGNAQPYLEWATRDNPEFGPDRRFYFDPIETDAYSHTVIPVYKHPKWTGEVEQLCVCFGNPQPGAAVIVQALFTTYDTRHDANGAFFVNGCAAYFIWTRDLNFLRRNMNRMRTALRYVMTEHQAAKQGVVYNTWVGHDGRSGLRPSKDGKKEILSGHGIGDNYWDLLPFGNKDTYATILYYRALLNMADIERAVQAHPGWNIPMGALALDPAELTKQAAKAKQIGNKLFWNPETGRFVPGVDADGKMHDYGFTFLNAEAIYYDFATPEHAKSIMSWMCGDRIVKGDTARGAEIYHWRFAPRSTTRRNIDFYFWAWSGPEGIPWGGQVQDGGAVLGFSYHDLMARLKVRGPDNAWARMREITKWFDETQAADGYRKYYDGSREGTLQGGGTAGGLGLDCEFFESVLAPQVMLDGFLGFAPTTDGFRIDPRLPSGWPELSVDRIRWHDLVLAVRATRDAIEITKEGKTDEPVFVALPEEGWQAAYIDAKGKPISSRRLTKREDGAFAVDWASASGVRFERSGGARPL